MTDFKDKTIHQFAKCVGREFALSPHIRSRVIGMVQTALTNTVGAFEHTEFEETVAREAHFWSKKLKENHKPGGTQDPTYQQLKDELERLVRIIHNVLPPKEAKFLVKGGLK